MQLDSAQIQKFKRGEAAGNAATGFCGAVLIYFIVCFTVAQVNDNTALRISTLVAAPVLMTSGAGVAAFCNLYYGAKLEKTVAQYMRAVFVENAALMHPEKESLTFYMSFDGASAKIKVNNFKESIIFDFSSFKKLSAARKAFIAAEAETRLTVTFLRLALERGENYKNIAVGGSAKKNAKLTFIIRDGKPEKRAMKIYLKNG